MLRSMIIGVISLMLAVAAPVFVLQPIPLQNADERLLIIETTKEEKSSGDDIRVFSSGQIISVPLEEYLVGVLINEMPLSFHPEALKAQAVAARTFAAKQISGGKHDAYDVCDQSTCCQAWSSTEALRVKLGDAFDASIEKAVCAVQDTTGKTMRFEGTYIDAVFFSCSGGMTEDAVAVWGTDVRYLQSVESPGEEQAAKYRSDVVLSPDEFLARMGLQDLTGSPESWFGEIHRSDAGGVLEICIGGKYYSGREIREKLGLNSTWFTITTAYDQIKIEVNGYGHRVGMSQYGANAMAMKGYNYQDILMHYYQGVEIQ